MAAANKGYNVSGLTDYVEINKDVLIRDLVLGFNDGDTIAKMGKQMGVKGSEVLKEMGITGEIFHTPGHSDDSISLLLDDGSLFVGDLNPLYELELHKGTQTEESWNKLLALNPKRVYYGHAKTADIDSIKEKPVSDKDMYELVSKIMKMTDKRMDANRIAKKTGADNEFIQDVLRMYLTHQNVGVQGILDRIEIKNK